MLMRKKKRVFVFHPNKTKTRSVVPPVGRTHARKIFSVLLKRPSSSRGCLFGKNKNICDGGGGGGGGDTSDVRGSHTEPSTASIVIARALPSSRPQPDGLT